MGLNYNELKALGNGIILEKEDTVVIEQTSQRYVKRKKSKIIEKFSRPMTEKRLADVCGQEKLEHKQQQIEHEQGERERHMNKQEQREERIANKQRGSIANKFNKEQLLGQQQQEEFKIVSRTKNGNYLNEIAKSNLENMILEKKLKKTTKKLCCLEQKLNNECGVIKAQQEEMRNVIDCNKTWSANLGGRHSTNQENYKDRKAANENYNCATNVAKNAACHCKLSNSAKFNENSCQISGDKESMGDNNLSVTTDPLNRKQTSNREVKKLTKYMLALAADNHKMIQKCGVMYSSCHGACCCSVLKNCAKRICQCSKFLAAGGYCMPQSAKETCLHCQFAQKQCNGNFHVHSPRFTKAKEQFYKKIEQLRREEDVYEKQRDQYIEDKQRQQQQQKEQQRNEMPSSWNENEMELSNKCYEKLQNEMINQILQSTVKLVEQTSKQCGGTMKKEEDESYQRESDIYEGYACEGRHEKGNRRNQCNVDGCKDCERSYDIGGVSNQRDRSSSEEYVEWERRFKRQDVRNQKEQGIYEDTDCERRQKINVGNQREQNIDEVCVGCVRRHEIEDARKHKKLSVHDEVRNQRNRSISQDSMDWEKEEIRCQRQQSIHQDHVDYETSRHEREQRRNQRETSIHEGSVHFEGRQPARNSNIDSNKTWSENLENQQNMNTNTTQTFYQRHSQSEYSLETLRMMSTMKIREYKPQKPVENSNKLLNEKNQRYQNYIKKYQEKQPDQIGLQSEEENPQRNGRIESFESNCTYPIQRSTINNQENPSNEAKIYDEEIHAYAPYETKQEEERLVQSGIAKDYNTNKSFADLTSVPRAPCKVYSDEERYYQQSQHYPLHYNEENQTQILIPAEDSMANATENVFQQKINQRLQEFCKQQKANNSQCYDVRSIKSTKNDVKTRSSSIQTAYKRNDVINGTNFSNSSTQHHKQLKVQEISETTTNDPKCRKTIYEEKEYQTQPAYKENIQHSYMEIQEMNRRMNTSNQPMASSWKAFKEFRKTVNTPEQVVSDTARYYNNKVDDEVYDKDSSRNMNEKPQRISHRDHQRNVNEECEIIMNEESQRLGKEKLQQRKNEDKSNKTIIDDIESNRIVDNSLKPHTLSTNYIKYFQEKRRQKQFLVDLEPILYKSGELNSQEILELMTSLDNSQQAVKARTLLECQNNDQLNSAATTSADLTTEQLNSPKIRTQMKAEKSTLWLKSANSKGIQTNCWDSTFKPKLKQIIQAEQLKEKPPKAENYHQQHRSKNVPHAKSLGSFCKEEKEEQNTSKNYKRSLLQRIQKASIQPSEVKLQEYRTSSYPNSATTYSTENLADKKATEILVKSAVAEVKLPQYETSSYPNSATTDSAENVVNEKPIEILNKTDSINKESKNIVANKNIQNSLDKSFVEQSPIKVPIKLDSIKTDEDITNKAIVMAEENINNKSQPMESYTKLFKESKQNELEAWNLTGTSEIMSTCRDENFKLNFDEDVKKTSTPLSFQQSLKDHSDSIPGDVFQSNDSKSLKSNIESNTIISSKDIQQKRAQNSTEPLSVRNYLYQDLQSPNADQQTDDLMRKPKENFNEELGSIQHNVSIESEFRQQQFHSISDEAFSKDNEENYNNYSRNLILPNEIRFHESTAIIAQDLAKENEFHTSYHSIPSTPEYQTKEEHSTKLHSTKTTNKNQNVQNKHFSRPSVSASTEDKRLRNVIASKSKRYVPSPSPKRLIEPKKELPTQRKGLLKNSPKIDYHKPNVANVRNIARNDDPYCLQRAGFYENAFYRDLTNNNVNQQCSRRETDLQNCNECIKCMDDYNGNSSYCSNLPVLPEFTHCPCMLNDHLAMLKIYNNGKDVI